MKQNPCRYCALAYEYKGKHKPRYAEPCRQCENIKKHKEYLESQRKFEIGEPIKSLQELMEQTYIYCGRTDVPKHIEVIKSWQFRIVMKTLEAGHFYKAIRKNTEGQDELFNRQ